MSTITADTRSPTTRTLETRLLLIGGAVLAIGAGAYLAALVHYPRIEMLKGFDLAVYRMGGLLVRHDPAHLYTWQLRPGIQFTYTPFAALLFAVATFVPFRLLMDLTVVTGTFALAVTLWIALRELGWEGRSRIAATMLLFGITLWFEPVQRTLFLGQVELVLMGLVVWDAAQPDSRRWKGAATGVAAGIKLVPLIFIAYLLITRRIRAAAVAAGTFIATVAIGFLALPHESVQWWWDGIFMRSGRAGFVGSHLNQSLEATLTRLAGSLDSGRPLWIAASVVVGILGIAAAALLHRRGRTFAGLMACALTALLISPISWDHHWVWAAPGLAVLFDAAMRAPSTRARVAWGVGAVAWGAAFFAWPRFWTSQALLQRGGLFWSAPASYFPWGDNRAFVEYHWHGLALVAGNLYVIAGIAMFVLLLGVAGRSLSTPSRRRADASPVAALR